MEVSISNAVSESPPKVIEAPSIVIAPAASKSNVLEGVIETVVTYIKVEE